MSAPLEPAAFPVQPRKRKVRAPPLMRTSRWLHRSGTIVTVVLIVLLATIGYSTSHLRAGSTGGLKSQTAFGDNVVTISTAINLTNGGFYSITGLTLDVVTYIVGGAVVGSTSAPGVSVGPGATYAIPIVITVNVAPGSTGQPLLVSNADLAFEGWLNATLGDLLTVSVGVTPSNQTSWSAPFEGFTVRVVTASGSAAVTVSFTNQASIPVVGTMAVVLSSASQICGTANIPVNAPSKSGSPYSASGTATLAAGCTPASAVATVSGSSPAYTFTIPQVSVS